MPILETLAVVVGSSISKGVVKRWVSDSSLAEEATSKVADLLMQAGLEYRERERTRRQLEEISEQIAERLEPYFTREFAGGLPPNEMEAAANAVARTIDRGFNDPAIALQAELDSEQLRAHLERLDPDATRDLAPAAIKLYELALSESCVYLIELVQALPEFAGLATAELLAKDRGILELLEQVLDRLPQPDEVGEELGFDVRYRRATIQALERIRLFGLPTVRRDITRYALGVAYISLRASIVEQQSAEYEEDDIGELDGSIDIETVVARSRRILIRGDAGSGKTTLLQWLAVSAATWELPDALDELWGATPFVVRLRQFADKPLPSPSDFVFEVASAIAGLQPDGWVEARLDEPETLVLIDGVDELPPERRPDVERWLRSLVNAFPDARWIVTSRPAAVDDGFELPDGFLQVQLLPMGLPDVERFITHWHEAVSRAQIFEHREAFRSRGVELFKLVRTEPALRRLASNPLLCAVLCALHADRQGTLPRDRVGVYRTALDALLFNRDAERGVAHRIALSEDQIYLLLSDLAWWLVSNHFTYAQGDVIRRRLASSLARMVDVPSAEEVLRHFVERTGLIGEPVVDRFEFIHKTFLEFLAAMYAADAQEIGTLVERATLDDWEEVVKLSIGVADPATRDLIVRGLLERSTKERTERARLLLLAAAGAATAPELDPDLRKDLEFHVVHLVPPTSSAQALALAKAGEMAVPALAYSSSLSADAARASVRALCFIGGPQALEQIAGYAGETRVRVIRELISGINSFDPADYAERILAKSPLDNGRLAVKGGSDLSYLRVLVYLRALELDAGGRSVDYDGLAAVEHLERLRLVKAYDLDELFQIGTHPELTRIDIEDAPNLNSLNGLDRGIVQELTLCDAPALEDVDELGHLDGLRQLRLNNTGVTNLDMLVGQSRLRKLVIARQPIESMAFVEQLDGLRTLELRAIEGSVDLSWLALAPKLHEVHIVEISDPVLFATFEYCGLNLLEISAWSEFAGTELAGVAGVKRLLLTDLDASQLDMESVGCEQLIINKCAALKTIVLPPLEMIEFKSCAVLSDLDSLSGHPTVKRVTLSDCPSLEDVSALTTCPRLEAVTVEHIADAVVSVLKDTSIVLL